jgi:gliding motility-associated-like protein
MRNRQFLFFFLFFIFLYGDASSQCNNGITNFPYFENFESGQNNWTSGGTNNDWTFGTPSKNVITAAASGLNCWIVGGLVNNSYISNANSWLQSPCFNFSALTNPQISCSIFWETEKKYDGANFQYSIDGGTSWQTVGSINSNVNCVGSNWYNYSGVNNLSSDGWSGNIQPNIGSCLGGDGSNGWVTAKHTLGNLAGATSVIFRFKFVSGNTCNNFNGFAVDDFVVSDATPNTVGFNYHCSGNNNVLFSNTSAICATNFLWNFGDAASVNNTSTTENPTHQFSAPGLYTVSLTATFPGNIVVNTTKQITILQVTTTVTSSIVCNGMNTGAISTSVIGGNNNYSYLWNTLPPQITASVANLPAGNYTVTVSSNNACTTLASITLTQPPLLVATIETKPALCGNNNGTAFANVTGGTAPYNFLWSNNAATALQNNLVPGVYSLTIKDLQNCTINLQGIKIADSSKSIAINLGKDTSFCPGEKLVLNPGNFSSYLWQNNSVAQTFTVTKTGTYYVQVKDADGCTARDTIEVVVDCSDLYFPTSFTPNKDQKNDTFGPLGNLAAVSNFNMVVYGRWGQVIFSTNNPFIKWNGMMSGKDADLGVYVWVASYAISNKPIVTKKGTIILLR